MFTNSSQRILDVHSNYVQNSSWTPTCILDG